MLNEMVFRSTDAPAEDGLSYWAECLGRACAPARLSSDRAHDFRATKRVLALGAMSMWSGTVEQLTLRRTSNLIRRSDPEQHHLLLIVEGTGVGTWDDHEAVYRPSDLLINDSSKPWGIRTTGSPVVTVGLEIPKTLLPLPRGTADRTIARPISAREGMGALLAQFLTQLSTDTTAYEPSDGPRLGTVLIDLVAALFAHTFETDKALSTDTHRRTLTLRIKHFIQQHLHDPHLTPADIAAAHHISLSYLHRLFQYEEATVAAWIRLQRLEAARRNLTDPALHSTPIHAIAARWGFTHAADFSRAFRTAYGLPPRDYRRQALQS
ncbi:helix-turn-helix domain-containing protein [Streptomyces sp. BP-8]